MTIQGEFAIISLLSGSIKFRTTIVKSYYQEVHNKEGEEDRGNIQTSGTYDNDKKTVNCEKSAQLEENKNKLPLQLKRRIKRRPKKKPPNVRFHIDYSSFLTDIIIPFSGQYFASKQKKVTGFIEKKIFQIVDLKDVPLDI